MKSKRNWWLPFLLVSMGIMACGKEEVVVDGTEEQSVMQVQEPETEDVASTGDIRIIQHELTSSVEDRVRCKGSYPEIAFSEDFQNSYPKLLDPMNYWNNQRATGVEETVGEYAGYADEMFQDEDGYYENSIDASVLRADEILFTVEEDYYLDGGGAHPGHYITITNYNPETGEYVELSDVLTEPADFAKLVRARIYEQHPDLKEEVENYVSDVLEDGKDYFQDKLDQDTYNWYIDGEGLHLIFSPYDIASYAAGYVETDFSYKDYPSLLKESYHMTKEESDALKGMVSKETGDKKEVDAVIAVIGVEEGVQGVQIENPCWGAYQSEDVTDEGSNFISLELESEEKSDWVDTDVWVKKMGVEQANLPYEDESYCYTLSASMGEEEETESILQIYDGKTYDLLYDYDLSLLCYGPDQKVGHYSNIRQYIRWAKLVDHYLYVSIAHYGYASEEGNANQMICIDTKTDKLLWKSDSLTCNSSNFQIVNDTIICGQGFTDEPDYIYLLNRYTGETMERMSVNSAAGQFEIKGDTLYLVCYNTEYQFKIVEKDN